jgi:hypothetical protein
MNPENLTDEQIHAQAQKWGYMSLEGRRKFIGLLPIIFKRKIYKKYKFGSIFEYAAKIAGLSKEHVQRTLNLDKKFQEIPKLHNLLVTGKVSVNKLARVASVAKPENEEFWATKVQVLPTRAVETLVRDEKSVHVHRSEPVKSSKSSPPLDLSAEVTERLTELQQKGININDLLLEFLQKRDLEIAREKEQLGEKAPETTSRYVSAKTRKIIEKEHGTCCSVPGCNRPAEVIHHTQRFGLTNRHDPRYMAPLCKAHHAIAHSIDVKVCEKRRL